MNTRLKAYIEGQILPRYEGYDKSHGIDHVRTVIENALELAKDLTADEDMVYAIAAYHDIGLCFGRADHHLTSARWLRQDERLREWFDETQINLMAAAIEDHRASADYEPRSLYGKIIAEADRDIEPLRIIERCVAYAYDHSDDHDPLVIRSKVLKHIQEKYGHEGYLKLWLDRRKNVEGLNTLRRWLDDGSIVSLVDSIIQKKQA